MSDDDLIRRSDAMSLYAPNNIFSAAQRKRIAALPAATDTAAWNAAIRAAAKMADEGMDSHRAIAADIRTLLKP